MNLDIEAYKYALSNLDDGFLFEKFALTFLSNTIGHQFNPVGGVKDKGIDGFMRVFQSKKNKGQIYQISTEKQAESKILRTVIKLQKNKIDFEKIVFVTNRKVNNKYDIEDRIHSKINKSIQIHDLNWFIGNIYENPGNVKAYETYIESHYHTFNRPGKQIAINDFEGDPRIFVFLKQQIEERGYSEEKLKTIEVLADSLILFFLEGTDPDQGIFLSRSELKEKIRSYIKFDPKNLFIVIDNRLEILSEKPNRKINHHKKEDLFCLPYETRKEIVKRDISDDKLLSKFKAETLELIKYNLSEEDVKVKDAYSLIESVIHKIFSEQGLEFSEFILSKGASYGNEKKLTDIVGNLVDDSTVVKKNKEAVKRALLFTLREIVYNGTENQRNFLSKLSNTYMMMFLMNWEPKIASFFDVLSSGLNLYVGNSILIPALSELHLKKENRRHWNLLQGANNSGANLFVNEKIIDELVAHFKKIELDYISYYQDYEEEYLEVESSFILINEILIRAYFYAKKRGLVYNFEGYLDGFVDPDFKSLREDLIELLKVEFGIQFIDSKSMNIEVDQDDLTTLIDALEPVKGNRQKAATDAWQILSIYEMRKYNNEAGSGGIFGYKTWWLSKDTSTFASIKNNLKDKYPTSCYIRPDFLYNYISLSPNKKEVDESFKQLFPTMLGVNLSYHMPPGIIEKIKVRIKEHTGYSKSRIPAILKRLVRDIKSSGEYVQDIDPNSIDKFLDEMFED